jgi:hypothetical protein
MHKNFAIQIFQHPDKITVIYDQHHENRSSADEQVSSGAVTLPIRAHLFKGLSASIRDADALNQVVTPRRATIGSVTPPQAVRAQGRRVARRRSRAL